MLETEGNIPQQPGASKSGPQPGAPYDYNLVLDTVQIPRVVYNDPALLPGARMLWGVIRRFAFKSGQCFATSGRLAEELGVHWRQVRRYCKQLVKAGLLRETEVPGKGTCRELLWSERFQGEGMANKPRAVPGAKKRRKKPKGGAKGDPCLIGQGTPALEDRPPLSSKTPLSLEASLEASYRKPLPLTPSPEIGISEGVTLVGSEEGEPKGRGAGADGLPAAPAQRMKPPIKPHTRKRGKVDPNSSGTTADQRDAGALARILCYHWLNSMPGEPPMATIDAVVKILRARRFDDTLYVLAVKAEIRRLQGGATDQTWLKMALEITGAGATGLLLDDAPAPAPVPPE